MQEQTNYAGIKTTNWGKAFENTRFRKKLIAGVILLVGILMMFPYFFAFIETRNGAILDDVLLRYIGPFDLSIPIFIVIWSTTLLFIFRSFYQPQIFLNVVYCLSFLSLVRMLSIYLTPLDPPATIKRPTHKYYLWWQRCFYDQRSFLFRPYFKHADAGHVS